jgi:hypothetical protein
MYLLEDESGNATIATVLWLPVYILFFSLVVDASLMFNAQIYLTRVAQDATRLSSLGELDTDTKFQDYVHTHAGDWVTAKRKLDPYGVIWTQLSASAGRYMAVGFFDSLDHITLYARAQQVKEN